MRLFSATLDWLLSQKKTLCLALGIMSASALPPFYAFPILFLTFSSLLLILNTAKDKKQSFTYGYWFGFGYFACNLSWIGNAVLIDAAKLGWLFPIIILAAGGFFGLFTALPALLSNLFKSFYSRWLAFAAWWSLFEWIRSFIFTGFPWNLLGSVLSFKLTLLQAASIIGTYGLSLAVLLICSAPALIFYYRNKKSIIISLGSILLIFGMLIGYGTYHLSSMKDTPSDTKIRLVQPAIPQKMKWNRQKLEQNFEQYINMSKQDGLEDIDFVIWGETATPFALDFEPQYLNKITQAIPSNGYLITGLVRYEFQEGDFHPLNSSFIIDKSGKIRNYYDKIHLVPFGEYIPFRRYFPEWITPVTNTITDFLAGDGHKSIKMDKQPSFGISICYEIIFPHQIINPKDKPDWLINLTNDGWYGISQGPYQHLVTTQLRAIEEGRSIVRAANTGISAVINPYGKILAQIDLNKTDIIDINLPQQMSIDTIYGKIGNFIPLILCLLNILIAFAIKNKHS